MPTHPVPGDLLRSRRLQAGVALGVCALVAVGVTTAWLGNRSAAPTRAGAALPPPAGSPLPAAPRPPVQSLGPAAAPAVPSVTPPGGSPSAKPGPSPARPVGIGQTRTFNVTLYGARDNDPAGSREIAYPTVHTEAGGTGTYRDPITFATDRSELAVGTRIYYPYLKRYFVMEDDCVECDADWRSGRAHIDLWAGTSTAKGILACEDALTRTGQVVVDPPSTLPVASTPIYNGSTCYRP